MSLRDPTKAVLKIQGKKKDKVRRKTEDDKEQRIFFADIFLDFCVQERNHQYSQRGLTTKKRKVPEPKLFY